MSDLEQFFATMRPMLLGKTRVPDAEAELGGSQSGTENFGFYRVLAKRNLFKIMRDVFGTVRTLALRQDEALWARLVMGYTAAHPPAARDPNEFGAQFAEWLAEHRKQTGEIPELLEELADYEWIRTAAYLSPNVEGDGFEERLFVRQYTHHVPDIHAALRRSTEAELPGRAPTVVLLFRHLRKHKLQDFYPTKAGLAVLARRQGATLPPGFGGFDDAALDQTEVEMIEHGILAPPPEDKS